MCDIDCLHGWVHIYTSPHIRPRARWHNTTKLSERPSTLGTALKKSSVGYRFSCSLLRTRMIKSGRLLRPWVHTRVLWVWRVVSRRRRRFVASIIQSPQEPKAGRDSPSFWMSGDQSVPAGPPRAMLFLAHMAKSLFDPICRMRRLLMGGGCLSFLWWSEAKSPYRLGCLSYPNPYLTEPSIGLNGQASIQAGHRPFRRFDAKHVNPRRCWRHPLDGASPGPLNYL